jgi:trehalose 6-phosphate synthase
LGQLIIVSNRVSVPVKTASARAGGLEVAVNAALKERPGIWFGWSGKVATRGTIATQTAVENEITFITIDLSKEDHQEYYRGLPTVSSGRFFTTVSTWPNSRVAT